MKILKLTMLFVSLLVIFTSCNDEMNAIDEDLPITMFTSKTSSFELDIEFITTCCDYAENPCYRAGNWIRAHQSGIGASPNLGKFIVDFSFCFCCSGEEYGKYEEGTGFLATITNDTIFFRLSGKANMFNEPDETGCIGLLNDLLTIIGGTGQFEKISGQLTTKSLFSDRFGKMMHNWKGVIENF